LKQLFTAAFVLALACSNQVQAETLRGSPASIDRQYQTAMAYGYAFVNSANTVADYVEARKLVRVSAGQNLVLHDVSYPYALPQTREFLTWLGGEYRTACGEKLTVTSLLRPSDRQPANSVARSVHPAGMAIDLRIPRGQKCRRWLEQTLLSLEKQQILDATRERYPPHYHVAVFSQVEPSGEAATAGMGRKYLVRKGDSLIRIAANTGVTTNQLRAANGLRGNLILAGQTLLIPSAPARSSVAQVQHGSGSGEITHRVKRGDTLWRIANRYDTSVEKLLETNKNVHGYLQIGQVLWITRG